MTIDEKTKLIVERGMEIVRTGRELEKGCGAQKCASCLSAQARTEVDREDESLDGSWWDSREDICMLEARSILAEKLGWEIN